MKPILTCCLLPGLLFILSGCHAELQPDNDPVEVSQPVNLDNDLPKQQVNVQDIIVFEEESRQCLVGDWSGIRARISFDEHKTPIRTLLQKFARVSHLNFVVADGIKGEVSAKVDSVLCTQALGAILHTKNLVAVREGNVVRVLPREDWQREMAR